MTGGMKRALHVCFLWMTLALVRLYRWLVSPLLSAVFGGQCRFYPSCSAYAEESLRRFGPVKGSWLALRRVCRCHPFHPGGEDPVPSLDEAVTRCESSKKAVAFHG